MFFTDADFNRSNTSSITSDISTLPNCFYRYHILTAAIPHQLLQTSLLYFFVFHRCSILTVVIPLELLQPSLPYPFFFTDAAISQQQNLFNCFRLLYITQLFFHRSQMQHFTLLNCFNRCSILTAVIPHQLLQTSLSYYFFYRCSILTANLYLIVFTDTAF